MLQSGHRAKISTALKGANGKDMVLSVCDKLDRWSQHTNVRGTVPAAALSRALHFQSQRRLLTALHATTG